MSILRGSFICAILAVAFGCQSDDSAKANSESNFADLILTGAKVFTANEQQPWADSVAIKNGKFVFVGDSAGALEFRSEATRLVDLDGRLVIPGLVDSHAHPGYIDVEQYGEISATTEEELLAAVKQYAEDHPGDDWLRLCCWPIDLYVEGDRGPVKETLDSVVADRPLWFVSAAWHSGWLNSKALEELGVDETTADPKPGVATFARMPSGEPTGWVKEGGGWQFFAEHFPIDEPEHKKSHEENVVAALQLLSESGVTTLYDAGNFGFEDRVYGFIAGLERAGKLPVRYEGTYQVFTPERRHSAVAEMRRYRREFGGDRLRFNTVKIFMDGIDSNRSSALLEPHTDNPGYVGETLLSVEELREFLLELNSEQLDVHIHAMGDLAVSRILDALEGVRDTAGEGFQSRVTISHLGLVKHSDIQRIVDLGVVCNFTPWWFTTDQGDPLREVLGTSRYEEIYRPNVLMKAGAVVTLSSDEWWGGDLLPTYLNPYFGMQVGHTRQFPDEWRETAEISRPPDSEKLSIEQIISGYTINGAYQLRMDDEIGSIENGKFADLVVLDDNLFDIDSDMIWKVVPAAVMMEGEVIQGALPIETVR